VTRERIPLARPAVGDPELTVISSVLASGRLVSGPLNQRFEGLLAKRCGRRHAVAVSSGTVALELAMWALGIGAGDGVLVPAFGFPSAASAAMRCGAEPIAVDVDAGTWNLAVAAAAEAIEPRVRAVVGIDQFGLVASTGELSAFARDRDIALIADSACALGGVDEAGVPGAGYGDVAVLSFHPRKIITTGEGGALLCDDDGLAAELRKLRNLGQAGPGAFERAGTNARLSEIAAAMGCAQLARLDELLSERALLVSGYRQRLAPLVDSGRISLQHVPAGAQHSHQTFAVLLAQRYERDTVRSALDDAGIESGPGTYAFTRLAAFAGAARALPVADALHDRSLALPLYIGMRSAELDRVAAALVEALS